MANPLILWPNQLIHNRVTNLMVIQSIDRDRRIHIAAKELVELKFKIDNRGRFSPEDVPDDLHGPYSSGDFGPFGSTFLYNIIPFLGYAEMSPKPKVKMQVPTMQTIGCSWRIWPDPEITEVEKIKTLELLCSESQIKQTDYIYIPELQLFFAHEGKNRVNFFRFHRIETIPALVKEMHYPAPERMTVFVLDCAGGKDVWAVLDDRYVQKLSHFSYALPMLRAYGVRVCYEWSEDLPDIRELTEYLINVDKPFDVHSRSIDLNHMQDRKQKIQRSFERNEEFVRCCYLELDTSLSFLSILKGIMLFFSLIFLLFFIVWNARDETIENVAMALLSFSLGVGFCVVAPIIKCKRKNLRQ